MNKVLRTLRSRVGRYVNRQMDAVSGVVRQKLNELLAYTEQILKQCTKSKLYALQEPDVEFKGVVHTPYKLGMKVSIATTLKDGLWSVRILSGTLIYTAVVGWRYRDVEYLLAPLILRLS